MDEPFIPAALPDTNPLPPEDRADLAEAVRLLERESLPLRLAGVVGGVASRGLGHLLRRLPAPVREMVQTTAASAAAKALDYTYSTVLPSLGQTRLPARFVDRGATAVSGMLGGLGGVTTTALELPFATGLMLRAIAHVGQAEGEDVHSPDTREECLKVLALGSPDGESYYTARLALAEAVAAAAGKAVGDFFPRVATVILPRFGLSATWKFAGQAVPVIGAASGALINVAFTAHYQDKARGHFIVRRLERKHGTALIRANYDKLRGNAPLN
jgi:hypothetical protein